MILSSALNLCLFIATAPEVNPVLGDDFAQTFEAIVTDAHSRELILSETWVSSLERASRESLRTHLELQVLSGAIEEDNSPPSALWWEELLLTNPRVGLEAVAHLDYDYLVWDVSRFPPARRDVLPKYRVALMRCLFEAFTAVERRIRDLQHEIDKFVSPDLTPPESLPSRASPESVRDPELRAEYEGRLAKSREQQHAKYILSQHEKIRAEALSVISGRVPVLYADAEQEEIAQLFAIILELGAEESQIVKEIAAKWPAFARFKNDSSP
jgi:hypothetical protein